MHYNAISRAGSIIFEQPQKSNVSATSQKSSFQSLFLLNTPYKQEVFQFLPKFFTITTNNGSSQFNVEMIKDASQVISNEIENNPNTVQYHLDITDDRNVLDKFSQLFLGKQVNFDNDDLPILHKIVRSLIISKCPDFMKPINRRNHQFQLGRGQREIPNEAKINQYSFNSFLINEYHDIFTISTHKKKYHCKLYAVYSSLIIRNLLLSNPTIRLFEYDFDDEFDEFELICKLLNFDTINITRNNMDSIKKISEDLQIECLLQQINNFIDDSDKVNDIFNDQQETIDIVDDMLSNLHRIKEISIETVKNYILQSIFVKTEDEVRELAAFLMQVIKTDPILHHELFELIVQLDKESKEFTHLKILLPLIIDQLFFLLGINKEICSFTYIMYKNELISKENLLECIKNRFDKYKQQYQESFCPLSEKHELTFIIHENIKEYFLPEMDIINKNPKHFDSSRIEMCEQKRNQIDDDIIISLKNDDVDKLQSIISNIHKDLTKVIISENIFNDIILNGRPSYINYSAGLGSIKCFKYLLLNQHTIDTDTLKFAIFGGNVEIIKIVDQNPPTNSNNKNTKSKGNNSDLIDVINMAIIKHRNDVFDWLLEQKLTNENSSNIFTSLITTAARNGNLHALTEIIDRGFDVSPKFEQIIDLSTCNGFYKFSQVICNIFTKEKEKLKMKKIIREIYYRQDDDDYDDDYDEYEDSFILDDNENKENYYFYNYKNNVIPSIIYGNLSIFKLYEYKKDMKNRDTYYYTFLFCIDKNYFSIIKYFSDNIMEKNDFSFDEKQIYGIFAFSIKKENDDFFNYLIEKFEHNPVMHNIINKMIDDACKYNKVEIVKKLFQIYLTNDKKDLTSSFIQAVSKNSLEMCQFFLENNAFINFDRSSFQKCDFSTIDEKMLSILNQYYPDEINQILVTETNLYEAIKKSNTFLIEYLIKSGAPSDYALIEAVKTDKIEIVDLILKFNNSPDFINKKSKEGTPLCIAVSNSNKIIVNQLLSLPGINPNYYDSNNDTPLKIAMKKLNIDIINSLLDFYGENIKSQSTQINQALQIFINKCNDIEMLPILERIIKIECVDLNIRDNDKSIFSLALMFKSKEIIDILLKSNRFDVNSYSPLNGDTPLIESIDSSNFEITKCLIELPQTDINLPNYQNETPLVIATIKDDLRIVDLLINNEKFNPEISQINYAFYLSSSRIAKKLISIKSLNVEYKDDTSNYNINTPLKLALDKCDSEKINIILDFYGDDIKSHSKQLTQFIKIFLSKFDKFAFKSYEFKINEMNKCLKRIIEVDDVDVNCCVNNNNLFTIALQYNNSDLIEILLNSNKFDVNSYLPQNGNTPLIAAILSRNIKIVKLLIENPKTDVNKKSQKNKTPLGTAIDTYKSFQRDSFLSDIMELLINNKNFDFEKNKFAQLFDYIPSQITKNLILSKKIDINFLFNSKSCSMALNNVLFDVKDNKNIKINQEMFDLITNHPLFNKTNFILSLFKSIKIPGIESFKQFLSLFDNDVNITTTNNYNNLSLLESAVLNQNKEVFLFILNDDKFDCTNKSILNALAMSFKFPLIQKNIFEYVQAHSKQINLNDINLSEFMKKYNFAFNTIKSNEDDSSSFISTVINYLVNTIGIDPNKPDEKGYYPLEIAIVNSLNDAVIALLKTNKIDYNVKIKVKSILNKSENYETYLHLAATKSQILDEFLSRKLIDINVTDSLGNTPLMNACLHKIKESVEIFFNYEDLDFLHKNNGGNDALMIANIDKTVRFDEKSIKNKKDYLNKLLEIFDKASKKPRIFRFGHRNPTPENNANVARIMNPQ